VSFRVGLWSEEKKSWEKKDGGGKLCGKRKEEGRGKPPDIGMVVTGRSPAEREHDTFFFFTHQEEKKRGREGRSCGVAIAH